jgi:hypothetical protein
VEKSALDTRLLRPALLRCLPWLFALAVVIILVDLFFFRYRFIGPTLFGILCVLGGVALGRSPRFVAYLLSDLHTQRWWVLFLPMPFLAIGILGLSYPLQLDLPDNASFMWDIWTPDGRYLGRFRTTQIFAAPAFLWMGSVWLTAIVCSWFARPRSQENATAGGSAPNAAGSTPVGAHPWIYTLGLYIVLILVTLRGMLSR